MTTAWRQSVKLIKLYSHFFRVKNFVTRKMAVTACNLKHKLFVLIWRCSQRWTPMHMQRREGSVEHRCICNEERMIWWYFTTPWMIKVHSFIITLKLGLIFGGTSVQRLKLIERSLTVTSLRSIINDICYVIKYLSIDGRSHGRNCMQGSNVKHIISYNSALITLGILTELFVCGNRITGIRFSHIFDGYSYWEPPWWSLITCKQGGLPCSFKIFKTRSTRRGHPGLQNHHTIEVHFERKTMIITYGGAL